MSIQYINYKEDDVVTMFDKYPELEKQLEALCRTRPNEILSHMVGTDDKYEDLRRNKADTSMALKEMLGNSNKDELFEAYSDAVYEQEIYELDAVYKQALYDAFEALVNKGIL